MCYSLKTEKIWPPILLLQQQTSASAPGPVRQSGEVFMLFSLNMDKGTVVHVELKNDFTGWGGGHPFIRSGIRWVSNYLPLK